MSGIAAIFRTDGGDVEHGAIEKITHAMAYRGPDGIAHWAKGPVALGHCMLRSTAESLEESQPLANEDESLILVLDGYLTNWEELRSELLTRGAHLRTRSDAELVLRAYEQWGEDCPRHIDGEYAFIVWDARRREVFCAKDHHGLRPLLYHWDGSTLIIASDNAALLAGLPQTPQLNNGYLAEIMANQWYTRDETVWAGVMRLLPAHSMRVTAAGIRRREYWTLPIEVSITYRTDEEYFEHYRAMFAECVRRASRSHVPVAFEVSGGLDSSSLYCMAHDLLKHGNLPAPDIRGYTLAGPAGTASDEIEYARAVGVHVGRSLTERPLFRPGLDWFTRQGHQDRDIPTYANCAMAVDLEQTMAADGCRVCIGGAGGDQWLDGNHNYFREQLRLRDWGGLWASLRDDAAHAGWRKGTARLMRSTIDTVLPGFASSAIRKVRAQVRRDQDVPAYWLNAAMQQELELRKQSYLASLSGSRLWGYKLDKLQFPYLMLLTDISTRQHARSGLEGRSPMLSRSFIEFSAATPERMRKRGGITKYIHRKALTGILPDVVTNRGTKAEFSAASRSNEEGLRDFFRNGLPEGLSQVADTKGVAQLFVAYCDATIDARSNWEVWGVYAYATLLSLLDGQDDKGTVI